MVIIGLGPSRGGDNEVKGACWNDIQEQLDTVSQGYSVDGFRLGSRHRETTRCTSK